jgi:hypothetical protein
MRTQERTQYVVIYRTGGTRNFKWTRSLSIPSFEDAIAKRNDVERMGYPAYVERLAASMVFGLPDTFVYERL